MPLVKGMGPVQILLPQESNIAPERPRSDVGPHPVVDGVTDDGCDNQQHHDQPQVQGSQRRERSRGKQQRITRKKGCDHQTRLTEHDHKQYEVSPGTVLGDEPPQVLVQVQEEVNDAVQQIHARSPESYSWRNPNSPTSGTKRTSAMVLVRTPSGRRSTRVSTWDVRSPSGMTMRPPGAS